jgi:hypothetical protein
LFQPKEEKRERRKKEGRRDREEEDSVLKINQFQPYEKDEHDYSNSMGCDRNTKVVDTAERVREDIRGYIKNTRDVPEMAENGPQEAGMEEGSLKGETIVPRYMLLY